MTNSRNRHRGFGAAMLLYMIALITIVGAASYKLVGNSQHVKWFNSTRDTILSQRDVIVGRLIQCEVFYPSGDNGTGYRIQYPAAASAVDVASLTCPGQPGTPSLWSGDSQMLLPQAPPGFDQWKYVNDATSMRLVLTTNTASSQNYLDLIDAVVTRLGNAAARNANSLVITLMN